MSTVKVYNSSTGQWEYAAIGAQGPTGPAGTVAVTAPITISGTSTAATIGFDPTGFVRTSIDNVLSSTTQSTSYQTGALVISGGVGIAKDLFVQGNLVLTGNIDINGTITGSLEQVNVTDLNVTDSMIYLGSENLTSDTVDIGIVGAYRPLGDVSGHKHTGFARDHNDSGIWKLFSGGDEVVGNDIAFGLNDVNVNFDQLKIKSLIVTDASTTRTNLGLGTMAVETASSYARKDQANAFTVGGHTITAESLGVTPLIVSGVGGTQTADILSIRQSTGSAFSGFDSSARLYVRSPSGNVSFAAFHLGTNNATVVGQVIRGFTSQTANLQEWQDSAGNILSLMSSAGQFVSTQRLTIGLSSVSSLANVTLGTGQPNRVGTAFFAQASQTADLTQYLASTFAVLGGRNANAQIFTGSTAPILSQVGGVPTGTIYGVGAGGSPTATTFQITLTSAPNLAVGDLITVDSLGFSGLNPNGTFVLTGVSNSGTFYVQYNLASTPGTIANLASSTVSAPAQASVTARSAGTKGLVVRGAASQTANLQEWQDSAGTVLASVTSAGRIISNPTGTGVLQLGDGTISKTAGSGFNFSSGLNNISSIGINTTATNAIPLQVRAHPTSFGDLLQLQNTAGTTLGGRNANAQIFTGSTAPITTVIGAAGAITSAAYVSATSATFTVAQTAQIFAVGQVITITGVSGGNYNQVVTVTGVATVSAGVTYTFTATGTGFTNVAGTGGAFALSPSGNGTTATINLISASNLVAGDLINVSGFTGTTTYNTGTGVYAAVTAVTNTAPYTVSYANTSTGTAANGAINIPYQATITARSLGTPTLALNAPTSYTGNLINFLINGVSFGRVDSGGIRMPSIANPTLFGNSNINLQTTGTVISASASASASIPLKIQNANTGTISGDLTQWLSNGSTVLAKVDASGNITAGSMTNGWANQAGDYTVPSTVTYLSIAGTPSTPTVTLPTATAGRALWIRNASTTGASVISSLANILQKTGGSPTNAILPGTLGAWALLVYTGSAWQIMASGT